MVEAGEAEQVAAGKIKKILRHFLTSSWSIYRLFPKATLEKLEIKIKDSEKEHLAEICIVVEGSLPFTDLIRETSVHERADSLFSTLRIWDTKFSTGILFYVLVAERSFMILHDKGVCEVLKLTGLESAFNDIAKEIEQQFALQNFSEGLELAINKIHLLLTSGEIAERWKGKAVDNSNEIADKILVIY